MKRATNPWAWAPVLPVDEILASLAENGGEEDVTELAMEARNALARTVHTKLGSLNGEVASVMTDIAVRHLISNLTSLEVIAMIQSRPELVVETRKLVAAAVARRRGSA